MAEIVKKTKALTKPKKAATEKPAAKQAAAIAETPAAKTVSHDEIAALARQYWAEGGYRDGHEAQDWLRAEKELHGKA